MLSLLIGIGCECLCVRVRTLCVVPFVRHSSTWRCVARQQTSFCQTKNTELSAVHQHRAAACTIRYNVCMWHQRRAVFVRLVLHTESSGIFQCVACVHVLSSSHTIQLENLWFSKMHLERIEQIERSAHMPQRKRIYINI